MSNSADLWALQSTDLAVEAIKRRLGELEKQRGASPEVKAARVATAEAEAELARLPRCAG